MKLLVYVRPWAASYFEYLARSAFPGARIVLISDFRGLGEFAIAERFTAYVDQRPAQVLWPSWLSPVDEHDIISRNYVLRGLTFERSRMMISAMARVLDEVVDEAAPTGVMCMSGDNYVLDLLSRAAMARNVPVCGMIPCPARGYTRVTMRGEYVGFRTVADDEAARATEILASPNFKPLDMLDWLSMYGSYVTLTRSLREKPKRFWFPIKRILSGDPHNFHYVGAAQSRVSFLSQGLFIDRYFTADWQSRLKAHDGLKVYLPLPAYPEATTDYHVAQQDLIDFQTVLFQTLEAFSADGRALLVLKEHPGMMGARPPGFYDGLRRRPDVLLVSGQVASLDLLAATDLTLTWTGTGGLEGAVRGRRVFTIGRPYYSSGRGFCEILSRDQIPQLPALARQFVEAGEAPAAPIDVVRRVLASCFPGEFRQLGFERRGADGRKEADELGRGIRENWDAWAASFPAAFRKHLAGQPTADGPGPSVSQ